MRRVLLLLLLAAMVGTSGCLTPDDKRQWQEAFKDLRGDNLEMKTMPSRREREKAIDKPVEKATE
jgi:hypothetical protein